MSNLTETDGGEKQNAEMVQILEDLLAKDENITARAVARFHPQLKAASSITRSAARSELLACYQHKQAEFRQWRGRVSKRSNSTMATALMEKDMRIAELERQIELLTASHVAMIRAVGELGGFSKWSKFYESYSEARAALSNMCPSPFNNEVLITKASTSKRKK